MAQKKVYAIPNVPTPNRPVIFDPDLFDGCKACVEVCQMDVLIPNLEKGAPPKTEPSVDAARALEA